MDHVNIFLSVGRDIDPTPFMSIPRQDIGRLTLSPHKWLKFVMFAICGADGVLSTTPHGPPVNDNASFANTSESYYFSPDVSVNDTPAFVDYQAFYERDTYSGTSLCSGAFRECIVRRDGDFCVVTATPKKYCDAVHIIPRCNSDAYIQFIVQSRRHLYTSESTETAIFGINDAQNGILLNCLLHRQFGHGAIAFLKTPNRALNCDDIPSGRVYPEYPHRITMQHLKPDMSYHPQPDADAHLPDGDSSPPALILDFMYGAAAYRLWKSNGVHESLLTYYSNHYKNLLKHEPSQGRSSDNSSGSKNHGTRISEGLLDAMDCLNTRLMMSYGVTPEGLAAQHQKQEDEKRLKEQETSRAKVMEWMGTASDAGPVVPDV